MSPTNQNIELNEDSAVNKLAFKYLPYWPLFLFFLILGITGTYIYLLYTKPLYEAKATIIIKDEKKGSEDSKMLEALTLISTKKIIENETEVLKSRSLMDNVVRNLHLYAQVFMEGKFIATSAYLSCPINIKALDPDSLTVVEKVPINIDLKNNKITIENKYQYPLNEWVKTPYGDLKFQLNPKYKQADKENAFYFSLFPVQRVARSFISNLNVTPVNKQSSILNLSLNDENSKRAEDILNELMMSYERASIDEKNNLAKNTFSFVEDRLNIVSKDLDSIEKKIQNYKSGQGAIDISTQGQLFLQNVSENDQKLSEVNMRLAVLGQVEDFVASKSNGGGTVPSTLGVSDPVLSQLLDKLYVSELEYEKLKTTVAENNPLLVSVRDQINKIRPSILENIQSQRRSLIASRGNLNSTNRNYNSLLQSIPAKERQLLEISREQAIKTNIYSFLLQKREESALSYSSNVSDSKIVDKAHASFAPVSPKTNMLYLTSIVLSLAFAFGVISARDFFNGKILYREEIEKFTQFPVLGEIAYQKAENPIVIEKGKRTFIAEEFRRIRMSLPYLGIGGKAKKILLTSSIPGEGKSFIAANLAITLSLIGKKVVLMDADLNNPSLVNIFDYSGEVGVTEYLLGEKEPEEIIKRVKQHDNLFFIPPGQLPNNPSELLSNGKSKELIEYLDQIFDFIIIDSAPVVPVTDAYILTQLCDATLYIVRHNYTPKLFVKRIDANNKINNLINPAIIFNGVKPRGFFKKSYGYGYGYGYVYDYSPKKNKKKNLA